MLSILHKKIGSRSSRMQFKHLKKLTKKLQNNNLMIEMYSGIITSYASYNIDQLLYLKSIYCDKSLSSKFNILNNEFPDLKLCLSTLKRMMKKLNLSRMLLVYHNKKGNYMSNKLTRFIVTKTISEYFQVGRKMISFDEASIQRRPRSQYGYAGVNERPIV
jgi:hypothetical protein